MKLVNGHPDRMGQPYRFPHQCPGYRACAIRRYLYRRRHLGEGRRMVYRRKLTGSGLVSTWPLFLLGQDGPKYA